MSKTPNQTSALPAQEYHPQITPPKAYGPKRVAPDTFTHLDGSAPQQQPKPKRSRAGHLAARPVDYDVSAAALVATVLDITCNSSAEASTLSMFFPPRL